MGRLVEDSRFGPRPMATLRHRDSRDDVARRLVRDLARHRIHGGQFSTPRAKFARTTPGETFISRSVFLRTNAIELLPGFKTICARLKGSPRPTKGRLTYQRHSDLTSVVH